MTLAQINELVANAGIVGSAFVMMGLWLYVRKPDASALTKRIASIAFPVATLTFAIMLMSGNDIIPAPWALIEVLTLWGAAAVIAGIIAARKRNWHSALDGIAGVLTCIGVGIGLLHIRTHEMTLLWLSLAVSIMILVRSIFSFTNTVLRKRELLK